MRKLTAFTHGAALTIMLLGGGPARAAGVAERIAASGKALSFDLATAGVADNMARRRSGVGVEWSPHIPYWKARVAPSGFVTAVDPRAMRYGVNVGKHRVDVRLTKPF